MMVMELGCVFVGRLSWKCPSVRGIPAFVGNKERKASYWEIISNETTLSLLTYSFIYFCLELHPTFSGPTPALRNPS